MRSDPGADLFLSGFMENLYKQHFGLIEAPFNITPDPNFLYLTSNHREGLAQLEYGIKARRGFIVLTGEVGTGKTTLIQALLARLSKHIHTALMFNSISSPLELVRSICEEFKLVEVLHERRDFHEYLCLINNFLLERYQVGENAAVIIDEAQNLTSDVLESVRLLSNFETTKDKLLQILLVGQPELNDRLNAPQLRQLKQRVTLRHHLRALTFNECKEYITSRLQHAGGSAIVFMPAAIELIHEFSGGLPRLVNIICDNSMMNAYALDQKRIEPALIQEVAEDLHLSNVSNRPVLIRRDNTSGTDRNLSAAAGVGKPQTVQLVKAKHAKGLAGDVNAVLNRGTVPQQFFVRMREELVDAMGPMAHIVLAEHAKRLDESLEHFARDRVGLLIDAVSGEIFDQSIRTRFRQKMAEKIANLEKA
jgi:type II secretory pathway predicted ATPase ExeA